MPIPPEEAVGSKCTTKNLYNHSSSNSSHNARWSEFEDPISEEQRLKELGRSHAIIRRFSRIETDNGQYSWKTRSIEIQSPQLKAILIKGFYDYPEWNPDDTPYTFSPPFKPFVHRWGKILKSVMQQEGESKEMEIQLLRTEIEPLLAPSFAAFDKVKATGVITFDSLWLILAPGDLMVSSEKGNLCVSKLRAACKVEAYNGEPTHWLLTLDRIDWNGSYCGFVKTSKYIFDFPGAKLVTKLATYPLEFAKDQNDIRDRLLARGKKFASLRGFHAATYNGKKYTPGTFEEIVKPVSGRIVVDTYAFYKCQNNVAPYLTRNFEVASSPGIAREPSKASEPSEAREAPKGQLRGEDSARKERKEELRPLTDLECILAVPRVKGFDLTTKEWCEFNVDDVQEPDWSNTPYDNLVLPEGERELIIAFADRPRHDNGGFDDFVRHKGESIIILLCGPPGVGKTLTAEAVAEKSRVPLYILSASDLGTSPQTVEPALNNALECCRLWDAVLLLDEADVFLEDRESNTLKRNEIVSIFLRRLEYYQGLMFLTTNRISAIDPAFKSRLDLILPYHDLDEPARRRVWVNFVSRLAPEVAQLSDCDLDELAKSEMNGREIKNTIKTALVLSARERPLGLKHLRVVLNIRKRVSDFDLDSRRVVKRQELGKRK